MQNSKPRRTGLLKHQLQVAKRRDSDRYEIVPISDTLSFEKGLFIFIRACQLLSQKIEGVILVGLAGPSGAGKTMFCEKLVTFMPGITIISMENYSDSSRVIDGNYDDPRVIDYNLLLENLNGLKAGKDVVGPIYDLKVGSRAGSRILKVPASRIVVIEGIHALNKNLQPVLDLRVAVRGGVHFDLVKRILRDINKAGQEAENIIQQISETVYPMYKAFIEPDLDSAQINIKNKVNPFSGFQNPTYILKSDRTVAVDQIRNILSPNSSEVHQETYDIYLLPPGEDPETCQSYLRLRNRDGKYSLMFEEIVVDNPFIIYPGISFEVTVRLLGGLMTLGYTIATILKRTSQVFADERLCIKVDKLEQLQRKYVQVQGSDRALVVETARTLGLEGSYIPHSYIEQIQLEKLISGLVVASEDLRTKLSLDESILSPRPNTLVIPNRNSTLCSKSPSWASSETKEISSSLQSVESNFRNETKKQKSFAEAKETPDGQGIKSQPLFSKDERYTQLNEKVSNLNERLEEVSSRLRDLGKDMSNISTSRAHSQNTAPYNGPSSFGHSNAFRNVMSRSFSQQNVVSFGSEPASFTNPSDLESFLLKEVKDLGRAQHHLFQQLDIMNDYICKELTHGKQYDDHKSSLMDFWNRKRFYSMGVGVLSSGFMIGMLSAKVLQKIQSTRNS